MAWCLVAAAPLRARLQHPPCAVSVSAACAESSACNAWTCRCGIDMGMRAGAFRRHTYREGNGWHRRFASCFGSVTGADWAVPFAFWYALQFRPQAIQVVTPVTPAAVAQEHVVVVRILFARFAGDLVNSIL
jgi:hypothetical protein